MKKKIKDSLRHLPGIVATLFLLAAAACMPESFKPGIETPGSQDRSPMTLEFDFSSSDVGIRTRANEDPMNDKTINSLWVGVFDVETGNLVGTCSKNQNKKNKDTVTVDVLYYDAHPTVRIFGVANYEGITGSSERLLGNDLKSLLDQVTTMSQFFSISVDTQSADKRLESGAAPLLMGVYTLDGNSAGLYTVAAKDESGEEFKPSDNDSDITLVTGTYDRFKRLTGGAIRLRRLLSQVNVQVIAGSGVSLTNIRYRVVNKPTQVYLQERTTQTTALDEDEWKVLSPNRADAIDGGYMSDEFTAPIAALPTDPNEPVFSFYQYENKHWGWGTPQEYNDREIVTTLPAKDGIPIFTALCGADGAHWYNNNASYFEIKMDVEVKEEDGKTISAKDVTYRIHEGYCNNEKGQLVSGNLPDFTCVRNTVYTYKITISGLTSFNVNATTHEHTNPGVLGNAVLWTNEETFEMNAEEGGDTNLDNTEIVGYICYYENGGDPMWYGAGDYMPLLSSPALPDLEHAKQIDPSEDAGFSFTIGDQNIANLFPATKAEAENSAVTIGGIIKANNDLYNVGNPKNYFHSLYLLKPIKYYDNDGCTQYPYYCIHFQPKDGRDVMPNKFDFSLAFANERDSETTAANGAVAGHIKDIRVLDPEWDTPPDAEKITFTVYVDDEKVADSIEDLDNISICTSLKNDGGNSIHTVKVVAITDEYQDAEFEKEFVVYPTEFEWSYRTYNSSYFISDGEGATGYYYGSTYWNLKDYETSNKYYALYQVASNMDNQGKYLNTIGSRDVFKINVPYDAVLTVYATSAKNDGPDLTRSLEVAQDGRSPQKSSVGLINNANGQTPFTFYVEKGSVTLSSTGNINIYAVKLTYHDPAASHKGEWVFSNPEWTEFCNALKFNSAGVTGFGETSINGLHIIGGEGKTLKAGTGYIQLGNTGAPDKCAFWFYAHKSGTLTVERENTDRNLIVATDDGPVEGSPFTQATKHSVELTITKPTKVYLYSGGNSINIKSITYTEK